MTDPHHATLTTAPLDRLFPSPENPREEPGDASELKQSIRNTGLLHSLTARAAGNGRYGIVDGCRRLACLLELQQEGAIPADYEAPLLVRQAAADLPDRQLALVANLQRRDLHPLDQGKAWHGLLQSGADIHELAEDTGVSLTTIRRRLSLNNLTDDARQAFHHGRMNLSQAQVLSLAPADRQADVLEDSESLRYGADRLQNILFHRQPTVAMARFDLDEYTGTLTHNLFADEETTYFDDVSQFLELQRKEARRLEKHHQESGAKFVIYSEDDYFDWWKYRPAPKRQKGGVIINLRHNGELDVRENQLPNNYGTSNTRALEKQDKPRPAYGPSLLADLNRHKSLAVQATLLDDRRRVLEIAVTQLLCGHAGIRRAEPHYALSNTFRLLQEDKKTDPARLPATYDRITRALDHTAQVVLDDDDRSGGDTPGWWDLTSGWGRDTAAVYRQVQTLGDADLEAALLALHVMAFGQVSVDQADDRDSFFNRVANDLGIAMRDHWRPDAYFLGQRTKDQLLALAAELNPASPPDTLPKDKKGLVAALAAFFASDDPKAAAWLPGPMAFPAADDAVVKPAAGKKATRKPRGRKAA